MRVDVWLSYCSVLLFIVIYRYLYYYLRYYLLFVVIRLVCLGYIGEWNGNVTGLSFLYFYVFEGGINFCGFIRNEVYI